MAFAPIAAFLYVVACVFGKPLRVGTGRTVRSADSATAGDYMLPLGEAEVLSPGEHITCVAWGAQAAE